ncbi:hypothetical protein Sm713_35370 [Streptomyces sp. TS71-3]|nr:hypothetical protein Sm713_35370 [Streptomyces sp. TS71-3]
MAVNAPARAASRDLAACLVYGGVRVLESLGSLTGSPWIYAVVALSVLLDVFVPVLPSGVLVITAATAAAAGSQASTGRVPHDVPDILFLILSAATASVLGDMVAYGLARQGGERLARTIGRSRRLAAAQERLGAALSRGGGVLVVLARFAPAGRSVVSLGAGAAHRKVREFLPWSALAGLAWAGYSVALGYFGGEWLGTTWVATAVSVLALFAAGAGAGYVMRRPADGAAASSGATAGVVFGAGGAGGAGAGSGTDAAGSGAAGASSGADSKGSGSSEGSERSEGSDRSESSERSERSEGSDTAGAGSGTPGAGSARAGSAAARTAVGGASAAAPTARRGARRAGRRGDDRGTGRRGGTRSGGQRVR